MEVCRCGFHFFGCEAQRKPTEIENKKAADSHHENHIGFCTFEDLDFQGESVEGELFVHVYRSSPGNKYDYAAQFMRMFIQELQRNDISWEPEDGTVCGAFNTEEEALAKFRKIQRGCIERIRNWQKKQNGAGCGLVCCTLAGAIWFFGSLLSQTHGATKVIVQVIAFALLFLPWWVPRLWKSGMDIFPEP